MKTKIIQAINYRLEKIEKMIDLSRENELYSVMLGYNDRHEELCALLSFIEKMEEEDE
jgi:hypothetical protein